MVKKHHRSFASMLFSTSKSEHIVSPLILMRVTGCASRLEEEEVAAPDSLVYVWDVFVPPVLTPALHGSLSLFNDEAAPVKPELRALPD